MKPSLPSDAAGAISREEKQQELAALFRSAVVRENTCLHSLLSYLADKCLRDGTEPPKEYTIGVEALGKPADYDPRIDPTVRVDIGKLRAKLRDYYGRQGRTDGISVEIPRGHYHLAFSRTTPEQHEPPRARWVLSPRWAAGVAGTLLLCIGFLVGRAWRPPVRPPELSTAMRALWGPLLGGASPVLISYGTPLFLKLDGSYYRDPRVNRPEHAEGIEELGRLFKALKPTAHRWVVNYTGLGEAEGVFQITRLLASQGVALQVQRSSNLSWEDMKGKHVILLGSHKFNTQIPELPVRSKFQVASRPPRVVNLHPRTGEVPEYRTVRSGPNGEIQEEYALVSMYPGLSQGTRLLVLACSSSDGTGAAAEYLTRPDTVKELVEKIARQGRTTVPDSFQVVIKAQMKGGVPVRLSHVVHHVLTAETPQHIEQPERLP